MVVQKFWKLRAEEPVPRGSVGPSGEGKLNIDLELRSHASVTKDGFCCRVNLLGEQVGQLTGTTVSSFIDWFRSNWNRNHRLKETVITLKWNSTVDTWEKMNTHNSFVNRIMKFCYYVWPSQVKVKLQMHNWACSSLIYYHCTLLFETKQWCAVHHNVLDCSHHQGYSWFKTIYTIAI